jgi:hypothetical protein
MREHGPMRGSLEQCMSLETTIRGRSWQFAMVTCYPLVHIVFVERQVLVTVFLF